MLWVWIIGGVLAGLVLLVVVVGSLLPKEHVASRSIQLAQPPEAVWATITDFARQPTWRPELRSVELVSEENGQPIWREIPKRGMPMTLQTMEADQPRRLVRRIADPKLPFGGRWIYELEPADGGCRLTITEQGEVYNPVFRFISRCFIDMASTIAGYQKNLAAHFGQQVEPQPVKAGL